MAVKALVFKNFNDQRLALVLKSYFAVGTALSPSKINDKESVFVGFGTSGKDSINITFFILIRRL